MDVQIHRKQGKSQNTTVKLLYEDVMTTKQQHCEER